MVLLLDWTCVKRHGAYWREDACATRLVSGGACGAASPQSCWLGAVSRTYARHCRPLFHLSKCAMRGDCSSYSKG